jgi:hypothetical protein
MIYVGELASFIELSSKLLVKHSCGEVPFRTCEQTLPEVDTLVGWGVSRSRPQEGGGSVMKNRHEMSEQ